MARGNLSFNQKEARKLKKKARYAETRYRETNNSEWLQKRDKYNDDANAYIRNHEADVKNQKAVISENNKTDDQIMNEAMRQNRRERNEREQAKMMQDSKKESLEIKKKKTREDILKKKKEQEEMMKKNEEEFSEQVEKFNEGKDEFIKDYLKEHPDKDYSTAHREFFREYKKMIEAREFKDSIVARMVDELGISEKEADESFIQMFKEGIEGQGHRGGRGQCQLVWNDGGAGKSSLVENIMKNGLEPSEDVFFIGPSQMGEVTSKL